VGVRGSDAPSGYAVRVRAADRARSAEGTTDGSRSGLILQLGNLMSRRSQFLSETRILCLQLARLRSRHSQFLLETCERMQAIESSSLGKCPEVLDGEQGQTIVIVTSRYYPRCLSNMSEKLGIDFRSLTPASESLSKLFDCLTIGV
jgi:hypothetical protein